MHNQEQQVYKWLVKRGSVLLFKVEISQIYFFKVG